MRKSAKMVQKYQSPVRVYKYPFELVMAVRRKIFFFFLKKIEILLPLHLKWKWILNRAISSLLKERYVSLFAFNLVFWDQCNGEFWNVSVGLTAFLLAFLFWIPISNVYSSKKCCDVFSECFWRVLLCISSCKYS